MIFDVENWIFAHYGREHFRPGLDRIGKALAGFKDLLQHSKIVTIAGTNGKGETTHRLASFLSDSTFCAWTSPHINSITERFSSEVGNISQDDFANLIKESHEIVSNEKYELTYYEFLFFVFCRWALLKKPKYLLLEVGLGGRLDAVNVLDADIVLLTSISRDHQEYLGKRYDQILSEKMGVIRSSSQIVSNFELKYIDERASRIAGLVGAHYQNLDSILPLPGFEFSKRNQFLAYAAFCILKGLTIRADQWKATPLGLPFRGQVINGRNEWHLFGSHNIDGVRKLIQFLKSTTYNSMAPLFSVVVASFSSREEKDVRVMLKMLKSSGLGEVIVTGFDHSKAYPKNELKKLASQEGLRFVDDLASQVQGWTHQKILVVGSYYFMSKLHPLFSNR